MTLRFKGVSCQLNLHLALNFVPETASQLVHTNPVHGWQGFPESDPTGGLYTVQRSTARNIAGHFAQVNIFALKYPCHQPGDITKPRDGLVRIQLHYVVKPGMKELVGRHWVTPFSKMVPHS